MTEVKIISWIFLSIAMASQTSPANIQSISTIADGINHAVPTQEELKLAIEWLIKNEQIQKEGKNYSLTKKGLINYNYATLKTNVILNIWKNLELQIKNVG
jgi:hypothetical protein